MAERIFQIISEAAKKLRDNDGIFSLPDQLALDALIPNSIFKRYTAAILPPGSRDAGHGLQAEFPQLVAGDIEAFAK